MAKKLFIFGIGGTGSRVIRSLMMLLASGVDMKGYTIVPIIIDPDQSNADLTRNSKLVNLYSRINKRITDKGDQNTFFKTDVKKITNISLKETNNKTYEQFIHLRSMSVEDRAMAEMLFSRANLDSDMNVGFKGNPNIGSVVLNQISSDQDFKDCLNEFNQGDKIFIISSIFGGTGASGFPLLLKTLRQNKDIPNPGTINNSEIGAVSVLPYFSLNPDEASAIDSTTFFSKAKAALRYYEDNVKSTNAMYYIGYAAPKIYHNCEGGSGQKNDANLIEVLAATAIVDFCNNSYPEQGQCFKEIGLSNKTADVTIKTLQESGLEKWAMPLTQLALFTKSYIYNRDFVVSNKDMNKKFKDKTSFHSGEFPSDVSRFLQEFDLWLKELSGNNPSFNPFNMEGDLKDLLNDVPSKKKGIFGSSLDKDYYNDEVNGTKPAGIEDEDIFLQMHCMASKTVYEKFFKK